MVLAVLLAACHRPHPRSCRHLMETRSRNGMLSSNLSKLAPVFWRFSTLLVFLLSQYITDDMASSCLNSCELGCSLLGFCFLFLLACPRRQHCVRDWHSRG